MASFSNVRRDLRPSASAEGIAVPGLADSIAVVSTAARGTHIAHLELAALQRNVSDASLSEPGTVVG